MTSSTFDMASLLELDAQTKPGGADDEWLRLVDYYEDRSRHLTKAKLLALGVGLEGNPAPLEVSLLRRVIDRLAVVYDRPPTRWLVRQGMRLPEDGAEHVTMIETLRRAQYDLAWRRADRLRALLRQCVLRVYPSDAKRGVVLRIFEPFNVARDPDPTVPDSLASDRRFALRIASSSSGETWEYWERDESGWVCAIVNESGSEVAEPPFPGNRCPYPVVPALLTYDDFPGGRPWLSPRFSRTAWVESINAVANDLLALVRHEAHSTLAVSTDDAQSVPTEHGPGQVWALPRDATAAVLTHNPKLRESQDILESLVRLWTLSEDLPASEFDRSKQVVTGATLRVQNRPLIARREAQLPLAESDERVAWAALRGVHNVHADGWGLPRLAEDTELEVELAPVDVPSEARELLEAAAKSLVLGSKSVIDLIQAEANVSRAQAIRIFERVAADREAYPPPASPRLVEEGPAVAEPPAPEPPGSLVEELGAPSMVDALAS